MSTQQSFTVTEADAGSRLDRFVSRHTGLSRATAIRLIEDGMVQVGRRRGRKGATLALGEVVALSGPAQDPQSTPPVPQPELPLEVLYEDAHLVAVNKPAGLPTHPLRPAERGTVASALVARYPECVAAAEHQREGGICHRLDVHTSGVLLAARDRAAWQAVRAAFKAGQVDKEYLALCVGTAQGEAGEVDRPLLPLPAHEKMKVAETPEEVYHEEALDAVTRYTVVQRGNGYTLLRVSATTGRRHQIRAHLAYLGLPLYGDQLYGAPPMTVEVGQALGPDHYAGAQGQFLHAARVRLPACSGGGVTVGPVEIAAPLPAARQLLLKLLLG